MSYVLPIGKAIFQPINSDGTLGKPVELEGLVQISISVEREPLHLNAEPYGSFTFPIFLGNQSKIRHLFFGCPAHIRWQMKHKGKPGWKHLLRSFRYS